MAKRARHGSVFLLAAICLMLLFIGDALIPVGAATAPPDIQRILDRGKLVVGICAQSRPPFFMTDGAGKLYGYDIDLAQEIAKQFKVGVEFDRSAQTYQELFEKLAGAEVDTVIAKFSRTAERAKYVRFSRPYLYLRRAILVNRVEAVRRKIEEYPLDYLRAAQVKIGVVAKTSFVEYAGEMFKKAEIVEYDSWPLAVEDLVKGRIVAALYDDHEIIRLVRQNPDIVLYASIYVLKDLKDPIAIAVPWQSTHLLAWIDAYLDTNDVQVDIDTLIKQFPEIYKEVTK